MRCASLAFLALFPCLAYANNLEPTGGTAAAVTAQAQPAATVPDAGKVGAAMGGDTAACGKAPTITSADVSEGLGSAALADADIYAERLSELPPKALDTVKNLNATYTVGEDVIKQNYYVAVCQRLQEKGIGPETLKPALAALAQTLGIAAPASAEAVPNQPAPAQPVTPAETQPAAPAGEKLAAAPESPATVAEPKAPEAAPTAPAPAAPSAPTDIQAPSTPSDAAAPAPAARSETAEQPKPDTTIAQAPAGVAQDPAATEQKPAPTEQAAAPTPPPSSVSPTPDQAAAPAAPSTEQAAAPATPPSGEQAAAPAAPTAPSSSSDQAAVPQPGTPGAEQPAAPETSTMARGETPAPGDAATGGQSPTAQPEPLPASPGSVEQPAVAAAPAQPEPQPAPSAPAEAQPTTPPAQPAEATPPAPPAPPASVAEAPATPAPQAAPPAADTAPAPAMTAEPPKAAPAEPTVTAEAPGTETKARALNLPGGVGQLSPEECRAVGVLTSCADLNAVLAQLLQKPLEYNHPKTMFLGRKTEIGLVLRTDWEGQGLPTEVSQEMKNLPGEVKQGLTKITRVMSAELTGRDFEIAPTGRQERTLVMPQPVNWSWQVKPTDSGTAKPLKLQLYAHIEGPNGTMPPMLIKTLDATIDVDVRTWDWILGQVRDLEPIYAVIAALLGLLTAVLTYFFTRRSESAGSSRRSGPVIGDLDQSGGAAPRRDEGDRPQG